MCIYRLSESSYTEQVTKSKALQDPSRYAHFQKEGLKLLKSISTNSTELQGILGQEYARIVALLQGRNPLANASAAVASGSNRRAAPPNTSAASLARTPQASRGPQSARVSAAPMPTPSTITSAAPGTSLSHAQMQGTSGTIASTSSLQAGPPAKRRRTTYDEKEVIDLT